MNINQDMFNIGIKQNHFKKCFICGIIFIQFSSHGQIWVMNARASKKNVP